MTPLSACVQAGHDPAYINLELRQPEHWNFKEASSCWHLLVFCTNRGSMKFLTIQFMFHEVSEANTAQGILLSAGSQRSSVVRVLPTNSVSYTQTHVSKQSFGREGAWLWLAGVWGVDRCDAADYYSSFWSSKPQLTPPDTLLAHHNSDHMLACYGSTYCMLVTSHLGRWSEVWHCTSPSASQVIIGLER